MADSHSMHLRQFLLALAAIIFVSQVAFALCPTGSAHIRVPAVVEGQEGGLLAISVHVSPGSGKVYTTTTPVVGRSTQLSQGTAARVGLEGAGAKLSECDVEYSIEDDSATSVDGPSAGLAMAVATMAAAKGVAIRDDVAITGAISEDGSAGDVGGIIDKAQAAARSGMAILVTPSQQLAENIVMRSLSEKYNFSAVQVSKYDEAYRIATSKKGEKFESGFKLNYKPEPKNLTKRSVGEDEMAFGRIALKINERLRQAAQAGGTAGTMGEYAKMYAEEADRNERIIAAGYPYTGANNAFLSLVNAEFLTTPPEAFGLDGAKAAVEKCVAQVPYVPATKNNVEWVIGYRARVGWAKQKLRDVSEAEGNFSSSEEKYAAARELYYATSWCLAAGELAKEAQKRGGEVVDGRAFAKMAKEQFEIEWSALEGSDVVDPEAVWHMKAANESIAAGENLAALYDIAYAKAMQKSLLREIGDEGAAEDGAGATDDGTNQGAANGSAKQGAVNRSANASRYGGIEYAPSSLWGRLYYSQGQYIAQDEAKRAPTDSYRVERLAKELDAQMAAVLKKIAEGGADGAGVEYESYSQRQGKDTGGTPENACAACGCAPYAAAGQAPGWEGTLAASIMMVALVGISAEMIAAKRNR